MTTQITIEQLAEKLNAKVWSKENVKRIYLDKGYNTKKMSTKTYIYQNEDGTFGVSCYIDCPSQSYKWIESQKDEIITNVKSEIEEALAETYFIVVNAEANYVDGSNRVQPLNKLYDSKDRMTDETKAINRVSKLGEGYSYIAMSKDDFNTREAELDVIDRTEREAKTKIEAETKAVAAASYSGDYVVGMQVQHVRFGVGEVVGEDEGTVSVQFGVDVKLLMKKFVQLQKVEAV